jgi:transposase, IS30 family
MRTSFQHLDLGDRATIQAQLTSGIRPGAIATVLNRARSTITREIHRNGWMAKPRMGTIAGGYRSGTADRRARVLAAKPRRRRKLEPGNPLWIRMLEQLQHGFSPVQIASILERMADPVQISHETIYTALYAMPRGQLRAHVLDLLRRHHKARRVEVKNRRSRSIPDMTLIDHRPMEVSERLVPGHWEGDLIIGKGNLSQVGTLVERTTLFVALVKLSDAKADTVAKGFSSILKRFKSQMRLSMTYDQGSEMSLHKTLTKATKVAVYFAHPHAPWERGICENTNGLLRDYLPKGTDLSVYSQKQLDAIAWQLNTRVRKTLAWKSPAELFLPKGTFDFAKYWSAIGTSKKRTPRIYRVAGKWKANHAPHLQTAPSVKLPSRNRGH